MSLRSILEKVTKPSSSHALGTLVAAGILLGAVGMIGFDFSLQATSTDEFCLSCHELADNVGKEYEGTSHHTNASGFRATCDDCHLPKEFGPKMVRKMRAIGEIYHHLKGTIDTPEKFDEHRMWMATKTWAFMNENDSRECRNCHKQDSWNLELQSEKAQQYHSGALAKGKTCIDCHKGLAHKLPPGIGEDEQLEGIDF